MTAAKPPTPVKPGTRAPVKVVAKNQSSRAPRPKSTGTKPTKPTKATKTTKATTLNIKKLARDLEREIAKREKELALPEQNLEIGTRHLMWMCRHVYGGWVPEALAPIWLGYVQGVLRVGGGPNVKEMAAMIREAVEGRESHDDQ